MNRIINLLVCISPILMGGVCEMVPMSDPVEYEDVIGEYKANFSDEFVDMLTLNNDSTYIHYYKSSTGIVYIDSCTWRFGYTNKDKRYASVDLNNYKYRFAFDPSNDFRLNKYRPNANDTASITLELGVFKKAGSISICFEVYGNAYKKIK